MYPLTAVNLLSRVRRRVKDGGGNRFSDTEMLEIADEVMGSDIFTTARSVASDREVTMTAYQNSDFTTVDARTQSLTLPEWVGDVRLIEGVMGSGRAVEIPRSEINFRHEVIGPSWHFTSDRPGTIYLVALPGAFTTVNVWYHRTYAPLHYGTAQAGAAAGTFRFGTDANTTGKVLNRAGLYVGLDIVCTNDSPAGVLDQTARITGYTGGSTRECTITPNWGTIPDATTQYSLAVPIPSQEVTAFLIELMAEACYDQLGETRPLPRLERLREEFSIAAQKRGGMQRIWNRGV